MNKVIVILGQTATGKTSLSIDIAKKFGCEVISCDSRQVYKKLDIGSAKITQKEMQGVLHYGLDIEQPNEKYSVAQFKKYSQGKIEEIFENNNTPLLVGGSGSYIDSVIFDHQFPAVKPDQVLRDELSRKSTEELYHTLKEKDPVRAENIDKQNPVRLIRALEIVATLGIVPPTSLSYEKESMKYETLFIGLALPREILKERIALRTKLRLEAKDENQNMLHEVKELLKSGVSTEWLEGLGLEYRYLTQYIHEEISYERMVELINTKSWQFAKRQNTWFKRNQNIKWFHPKHDVEKIIEEVEKFLENK